MKSEKFQNTLYALAAAAATFLLIFSIGFLRDSPVTDEIVPVRKALVSIDGGACEERDLPCVLSGLKPNTPVSLSAPIRPDIDDGVLIRTDFSPADISFDGVSVFKMGKPENYPRFMKCPGSEVHVIETFGDGSEKELRIDCLSPECGGRLILRQPLVGSSKELLMDCGERFGLPMALSAVQIAGGIAMMLVSVYVGLIDRKGLLFLWLGLYSALVGFWFFGSNDAAVTLFPQAAFLYLSSFTGLILSPAVLFRFVRESIEFRNPLPVRGLEFFFSLAALGLMLLQLTGAVPFHRSVLPLIPLFIAGVILLICLVVREYRLTQNIDARRFILPTAVILASVLLAFADMLFPLSSGFSVLSQAGVILFLLIIGVMVGIYVKDSLDLQKQLNRLNYEENLIRVQNEEQRIFAAQLVKNEEALSRQRHDLRHHLTAVRELAGDNRKLQDYLSALEEKIPKKGERFCENSVVNAVISHYASVCEQEGIELSARLAVPNTSVQSADSDLCVVFSNLLENAAEACSRMDTGKKYIRLCSTVHSKTLTITMDNSFNGKVTKIGERFRSAKRNGYGVGLASVRSIAEEAHGGADFRAEGNVFYSSVYIRLP